MNEKIEFSVVIPTYNRAQSLARALDSVLAQSLPAIEIVVVDDGSTDQTRQLIQERYPQVNYFYQANRGVSKARNLGVSKTRGTWLAFLDSDDEWLPNKLCRQFESIESRPDHQLCHSDEIWIRNGRRVNPMAKHSKSGGYIFDKCLSLCAISPSSVVISRHLFLDCGGFDESLPACEDYDLWLRICAASEVLYVDEPLIRKFGGHRDQLSKQFWGMDRFRVIAIEKLIMSGELTNEQHNAACETLVKKAEILAGGALKRGRKDRARFYLDLVSRYRGHSGPRYGDQVSDSAKSRDRGNHVDQDNDKASGSYPCQTAKSCQLRQ